MTTNNPETAPSNSATGRRKTRPGKNQRVSWRQNLEEQSTRELRDEDSWADDADLEDQREKLEQTRSKVGTARKKKKDPLKLFLAKPHVIEKPDPILGSFPRVFDIAKHSSEVRKYMAVDQESVLEVTQEYWDDVLTTAPMMKAAKERVLASSEMPTDAEVGDTAIIFSVSATLNAAESVGDEVKEDDVVRRFNAVVPRVLGSVLALAAPLRMPEFGGVILTTPDPKELSAHMLRYGYLRSEGVPIKFAAQWFYAPRTKTDKLTRTWLAVKLTAYLRSLKVIKVITGSELFSGEAPNWWAAVKEHLIPDEKGKLLDWLWKPPADTAASWVRSLNDCRDVLYPKLPPLTETALDFNQYRPVTFSSWANALREKVRTVYERLHTVDSNTFRGSQGSKVSISSRNQRRTPDDDTAGSKIVSIQSPGPVPDDEARAGILFPVRVLVDYHLNLTTKSSLLLDVVTERIRYSQSDAVELKKQQ